MVISLHQTRKRLNHMVTTNNKSFQLKLPRKFKFTTTFNSEMNFIEFLPSYIMAKRVALKGPKMHILRALLIENKHVMIERNVYLKNRKNQVSGIT